MRAAVVVAGGYSTRFGNEDKAVADLAGKPLVRHVTDRVAPIVDDVVVNCRRGQTDRLRLVFADADYAVRFAEDPVPDEGPLAGICTGLGAVQAGSDHEFALVVACDMPFVDPAFVDHLFSIVERREHEGAVPRLDDGWYQTTQAVYAVDPMIAACERALACGAGKILTAVSALDYAVVDEATVRSVASLDTFENVNTRAELEAAADRLG